MSGGDERQRLLQAGAARLATEAFAAVRFEDVARDAGLDLQLVRAIFPRKTDLAGAILDHERASMRSTMEEIVGRDLPPLEKVVRAFERVGQNCHEDLLVRAGVRLASESRRHFPERRLDPFETWRAFITAQLLHARGEGVLRDINIRGAVWVLVSAGIGTKNLIAFHDSWDSAADQMAATARTIVCLISDPTAQSTEMTL